MTQKEVKEIIACFYDTCCRTNDVVFKVTQRIGSMGIVSRLKFVVDESVNLDKIVEFREFIRTFDRPGVKVDCDMIDGKPALAIIVEEVF